MSTNSSDHTLDANPFADPSAFEVTERDIIAEATLTVGRNATLTLGKDSLILFDEERNRRESRFCGLIPQNSSATLAIPFFNILSATISQSYLTIRYARPISPKKSKSGVFVDTLHYEILSTHGLAEKWVVRLLARAYGPSSRNRRVKLLINPFGGQGKAPKMCNEEIIPIFEAAEWIVDAETTKYSGHAKEIAEKLDIEQYDVIACASGDGLPHEVFNGLGRKPNASEALKKIAVVQLPCGSGNAMCWNLNGTGSPSLAALTIVKGVRTPLDLVSITQGNQRTLSFLSQSIGIVAESDLGTDNIRWMGDFRFTLGFLVRLLGQTMYPIDISVKTEIEQKSEIKAHYGREMMKRKALGNIPRSHDILDKDLETSTALGLPPLKYGTIKDPIPADWEPMSTYSNLGNLYCGNMCYMAADTPFFAASLPNDGLLDFVTVDGDIPRLKAVGLLLDVENNKFLDSPLVRYRKVSGIRVVPRFGWEGAPKKAENLNMKDGIMAKIIAKLSGGSSDKEGFFSVDGEKLPFEPFQIEVHRGLGTVLSRQWRIYEFGEGPKGWDQVIPMKSSVEIDHPQERAL